MISTRGFTPVQENLVPNLSSWAKLVRKKGIANNISEKYTYHDTRYTCTNVILYEN